DACVDAKEGLRCDGRKTSSRRICCPAARATFTGPRIARWLLCSVAALAFAWPVMAQEVLPRPEPPFKGKIGRTVKTSVPDFPKAVEAPKGAPNVLLILTDDVGFGASSTLGGPCQTPPLDPAAAS